jgi:RNA polymerase sigma-70 factor (ECF subfamily)
MPEPALRLVRADDAEVADAVHALVRAHFEEVWRLLRRLGLPEVDADDAAQHVFTVACTRFASIRQGSERAFLYGCALNRAAKWRESQQRRDRPTASGEIEVAEDDVPSVDELVERQKARKLLDAILDTMPEELRTVFVLFEFEELSTPEIAELLGIPRGTAASRLRRAREDFEKRLSRVESRLGFQGARR